MAQNDINDVLDYLRRIKRGDNLNSIKIIDQIETLEPMFIEVFKVVNGCVSASPKVELTLLEFIQGNTSLRYNYELNDSNLSEYMDCLNKNLNDYLMMCLEWGRSNHSLPSEEILETNRFIKQLKIVQKKMRFLRYLYVSEINGYIDHEKLESLETRIQFVAGNVGQFCLALSVVGDKDDIFSKPPYLLCLIVLVELEMKKIFLGELKTSKFTQSRTFKDKKLPKGFSHHLCSLLVHLRNKKLENFPNSVSSRNIDVAIEFLLVSLMMMGKLNDMLKFESGLVFMMRPHIAILEKEISSLSSIFRDVAQMHHEHKILKDIRRHTINLAYEAEVAIDSILAQYNAFWHIFCSLPTILKEIMNSGRWTLLLSLVMA
ncbi:hypothetical protein T459_08826 [Capsicum annuum]|uniref:Uncharacterized protein n=1 Tax=Capsicum annuum TaxID=4072 RepID=A0A2G2ZXK5_CAPAN|nr:putative late blight resistance protein -like protein R1B-14 isoform 2 [Capsicum annuum]PHT86720.1 hypothetical protein T459_08826 [Capsicum annuum]